MQQSLVDLLLNKATNNIEFVLEQEDSNGNTPLMLAIVLKKQDIVKTILSKVATIEEGKNIDINSRSFNNYFSYLETRFMGLFHGGADKYVLKQFGNALKSGDSSSAIKYAEILQLEERDIINKKITAITNRNLGIINTNGTSNQNKNETKPLKKEPSNIDQTPDSKLKI